jgi:hypothetical protein
MLTLLERHHFKDFLICCYYLQVIMFVQKQATLEVLERDEKVRVKEFRNLK